MLYGDPQTLWKGKNSLKLAKIEVLHFLNRARLTLLHRHSQKSINNSSEVALDYCSSSLISEGLSVASTLLPEAWIAAKLNPTCSKFLRSEQLCRSLQPLKLAAAGAVKNFTLIRALLQCFSLSTDLSRIRLKGCAIISLVYNVTQAVQNIHSESWKFWKVKFAHLYSIPQSGELLVRVALCVFFLCTVQKALLCIYELKNINQRKNMSTNATTTTLHNCWYWTLAKRFVLFKMT